MASKTVTIGTDAEIFLKDRDGFFPVIGLIGGTKDKPLPVKDGALQEDNVMLEINIEPCTTAKQWEDRITGVIAQAKDKLAGLEFCYVPSAPFGEHFLAHPQAAASGCDPDFNVYEHTKNTPVSLKGRNLRFAGGHIHIGHPDAVNNPEFRDSLIRCLDLFLGVPSVLLDTDEERRATYGKAGNFRPKPYGLEYRTLSNFWLRTPELRYWAFREAMFAVRWAEGRDPLPAEGKYTQLMRRVINGEEPKAMAERVYNMFTGNRLDVSKLAA